MSDSSEHDGRDDVPLSEETLEVINSIGQIIGQGGHGTVYLHTDTQDIVIKEIRTDNMGADNLHQLIDKLSMPIHLDHPNVLSYDKVLPAPGFLYVTMPRCSESVEATLRNHKRKQKKLSMETVFKITQHVSAALAYLHSATKTDSNGNNLPVIIHGDLKLDNILVDRNKDKFMVADIGLHDSLLNQNTKTANAPLYIAPEILDGNRFSTASDMWSLGAILYELETCVKFMPYRDSDTGLSLPTNWMVDLSLVKDVLIKGMLEHLLVLDPKDRLSADEVAAICGSPAENISISEMKSAATQRMCDVQIRKNREKRKIHQYTNDGSDHSIWNVDFDILLESTDLLNEKYIDENEQLIWAVRNNNTSLVKSLLDKGVVLKRTKTGMSCLMYAAQMGSIAVVKLLMEREQCIQDSTGKTALMYAIASGRDSIAELLCPSENMMQDNRGRTALMYATVTRRHKLIEHLVKYESRSQDVNGVTALMYAARIGDADAIIILAEKEANMRDRHNETAMFYALKSGNMEAAQKLNEFECLADSVGRTVLMLATTQNNLEKVHLFIPLHSKKKTTGQETFLGLTVKNRTALMEAAAFGRVDAVKILLTHEAKIQDAYGRTALMYAAAGGHTKIVELLIEHEKGIKDNDGQSALHYVIRNASMELLELLVSHLDPTNDKGVTALMRAADNGDVQMVKLLVPLQKGSITTEEEQINGCLMSGRTALMGAAAYGHTNIIELLLDYEKGMTNNEDYTALKIAEQCGNQSAIEMLSKCPEENK